MQTIKYVCKYVSIRWSRYSIVENADLHADVELGSPVKETPLPLMLPKDAIGDGECQLALPIVYV